MDFFFTIFKERIAFVKLGIMYMFYD